MANGILQLEEYYPNALEETYKGVAGYIYTAKDITDSGYCIGIPDAGTSGIPVPVCSCEYVPDTYAEIIAAESNGLIKIVRKLEWIRKTVAQEYTDAEEQPDYRYFIEEKLLKHFS